MSLARLRGLALGSRVERLSRRAISLWPYARRLGGDFWQFYDYLQEAQHHSPDRLREEQFRALTGTVAWVYERSGFYRRLWDAHGVGPRDLRAPEDLARFPVVTRDDLFHATELDVPSKGRMVTSTSGTTGTPFRFWTDRRSASLELAAIFHQWSRAGFRPGDLRVELRGFQLEPIVEYPDHAMVRFSVVNMEAHLDAMVAYLNRRRVPFLHGYPSAISKFSGLLQDRGIELEYPVRGVFLASEAVYDGQVEAIEQVLAPEHVIAHFGTAERVVLGAWCERARTYHFLDPYGVFEQGRDGEIIGTSLIVRATPFVRYRLSDVAQDVSTAPCPACGRGYSPVVGSIAGRLEDYLVTERGEAIPPAVVTFAFKGLRAIRACQLVQRIDRSIVVRCVVAAGSADVVEGERAQLRNELQRLLGTSIPVSFEEVEEIAPTASGKVKWIVSEIHGAAIHRDAA